MTSVLVMIPFTILIGFIGDRIRKWRLELIILGYALVFSHTFIIYVANSFAVLIVATVVGGIGASVFHPIALPLLSQEFGAERNLAHSFNLIFGTIGAIITPIATIGLSSWLGWRTATLILGIFGAICFPILVILLLLVKKYQKYKPIEDIVMGEKVISHEKRVKKSNRKKRFALGIITAPLVVVVIAQVIRAGIFRIINTFTSFIFEDQFGATKFNSALIMAIVIGAGGASTFISGFISPRFGSLKTLIISNVGSTIAAVFIAIFIGTLVIKNIDLKTSAFGITLLVTAVILFVFLTATYYPGDPANNSLFAEMIPLEILSSANGIITALMIGISSVAPLLFGYIVDKQYNLPYQYLLPIILSVIPLALLFYIKSKIGFKTPEQVESERAMVLLNNNSSEKE